MGKSISEKQTAWGSKFLEQVSKDLVEEFPDLKGFSVTNLKYCKLFFEFFSIRPQLGDELKIIPKELYINTESQKTKSPQVGDELKNSQIINSSQVVNELSPQLENELPNPKIFNIPWGHIKVIITKIKDKEIANYYVHQTIENNWSRDVLAMQIESDLFGRQGKAITNFKNTLPAPLSDLAIQTIKDPYIFDF